MILNINYLLFLSLFILFSSIYLLLHFNKEKFQYSNNDMLNPFTTNKFLYAAGPISNKDCSHYCKNRFNKCKSYFPFGTNNWCDYDYNECKQSCEWNSVFSTSSDK